MDFIYRLLNEIENLLNEVEFLKRKGQNISSNLVDLEILLNQLCYLLLERNHQAINVVTPDEFLAIEKASLGVKVSIKGKLAVKFANLITELIPLDEKRMQIILTLLRPF